MVDLVRSGAIGRPLFARATSPRRLTFHEWDSRRSREKTGGGCWIDVGGEVAQLFVSYGHKLPGYQHDWPHGYLNAIEVYGDGIRYVIRSPSAEAPWIVA
jgi:hypothetical protein